MITTKEQRDEILEKAKPLIKWLNENADPHIKIIIEYDSVKLIQESCTIKIDEFIL